MRDDRDPSGHADELERAYHELGRLRRTLETGRRGASAEWIAAAESAVADAERQIILAGGDPADERVSEDSPSSLKDAVRVDGPDDAFR
jgi:hypothetical protein